MTAQKITLTKVSSGAQISVTEDLLIGRNPECGLSVAEGRCSGKHALLSMVDGAVWLHDLNSTNGTYLNGKRLDSKVKLRPDDQLRFDTEEFLFHMETQGGPNRVPPAWLTVQRNDRGTMIVSEKEIERQLERNRHAPLRNKWTSELDAPVLIFWDGAMPTCVRLDRSAKSEPQEWTIGSAATCDITIQASSVSALHATIRNTDRKWKLISQMSLNGTYVNNKLITTKFLSSDDLIRFGAVECRFCLPRPVSEKVPAGANRQPGRLKLALLGLWRKANKSARADPG